ncbi:LPS export ABC transporter periplasmic protein LptC [Novosphingobium sp. TH158]|uniref:LPS export ABC transporter periplasmic protein LptC n=1 Tax=Novosphingobium sp. TH158 TaxID=2067455 RepID=UPI000C7E200B|nr:LPS export ABC transporter periplasmic protein LptC [Novosphingobium sp. TH158]PLK27377.1 LPS export ABC transporter periplasmic protein LptC [Novosphingobium sp. TH158]
MTQAADIIRDKRQHLALPGGKHDQVVHWLARVLPAGVGAIVAIMVVAPLFPRGEVSFLLDRNKVAVAKERIRVEGAMYRGEDRKGRPFSVTAGSASQPDASQEVVIMRDLAARILLSDGPAELKATDGAFYYDTNRVEVRGPVDFRAAGGYRLTTSAVTIDLRQQHVTGAGGVAGAIPAGTFSADRIDADLDERTIALSGKARLSMQPGRFAVPVE